jgi:hypothetical protein
MIMVIGPHRKKSETKAQAGPPQNRPVPSPRAAAAAAPAETGVSDADQATTGRAQTDNQPAADGAAVPGTA